MAQYSRTALTDAGVIIARRMMDDDSLHLTFTGIASGDGQYSAGESLAAKTALKSQKQFFPLSSKRVTEDQTVQLKYIISNVNPDGTPLTVGYYVREVGIFAQVGSEAAVLYAIAVADEGTADYLPEYNELQPSTITMDWFLTVANTENISIAASTTAYALATDLAETNDEVATKLTAQGGDASAVVIDTVTASTASYPAVAEGDTLSEAAGKVNKSISDLNSNKLNKTGDAADAVVGSATESTASYPVPAAGDSFKVIIGKIAKFFGDIKGAITGLSISGKTITWTKANGTTGTLTTQDTTYGVVSKTANGLAPQLPNESTTTKYLRQDGSWQVPPNTTYSDFTKATASAAGTHGLVPAPAAGKQGQYLRGDATWATPTNTTYSAGSGLSLSGTTFNHGSTVTAGTAGQSTASSGRNTLAVPYVTYNATGHVTAAGTHTHTISAMSAATASAAGQTGLVPAPAAGKQGQYLRGDGAWATPTNTTYDLSYTAVNATLNTTYCQTGGIAKYFKQKCNGKSVVTAVFDVNLKGSYSSESVATIASGYPQPVEGHGPVSTCVGTSTGLGAISTFVLTDTGLLRPHYCGTVSGHWYGTLTYISK